MVLTLGLVYNVQQFSGVMFHVVADVRRKKKTIMDVLAAGGRYDALVRVNSIYMRKWDKHRGYNSLQVVFRFHDAFFMTLFIPNTTKN